MAYKDDMVESLVLLDNASATSGYVTVRGGKYIWSLEGTFNGGSYQLQAKCANGTAVNITSATLSAAGFYELFLAAGMEIRAVETGSTSAMYSKLTSVP